MAVAANNETMAVGRQLSIAPISKGSDAAFRTDRTK